MHVQKNKKFKSYQTEFIIHVILGNYNSIA